MRLLSDRYDPNTDMQRSTQKNDSQVRSEDMNVRMKSMLVEETG